MNNQQITLETPRLRLQTMRPEDLDALLAIFGDPQVMAAFAELPFNREQMQHWLQRNLDHQNEHGFGLFSVLLKESGVLIGDCGLEVIDLDGIVAAELGYDFRSDYWNMGYATEAATAVRDYAVGQIGVPRLVSLIRVGNAASQRVAEKVGMHLAETFQRGERWYWLYELAPAPL